jgi:hypothetical protein
VGGIQAPEEQHKPEQQNAPDPEDTVPHTTVGDPGVQDVHLKCIVMKFHLLNVIVKSGFKMMVPL